MSMYHAKDLAAMPKDDLWALPEGPMKVVFDDGILETDKRATVYSAYMWGLYVSHPNTPALKYHHIGNQRMGSSTHMDLLGRVIWDAYEAYGRTLNVEELCRYAYEATNVLYNEMTYRLEAYVPTLSILDFIDVIEHPVVKKANEEALPTQVSIDRTYRTIKSVLQDPKELVGNPVAIAAKNGLVSMGQILQCVGPRGFVTDVDSNIFRFPIMTGFAHGINDLYGKMIESRSAAKALTFTEKPLQETEYFNRRLQLLAATLSTIHPGDCGSQRYMPWHIEAGDLAVLAGKYYLTDKGLRILQESDTHLRGETLQLRTVFHCLHQDRNGVCATCFGDLALSIPAHTNIGHVSATALCEQVSQKVLSTKHEDGSAGSNTIELSEFDQQYLKIGTDPNHIQLADRLEHKHVILTVNQVGAQNLASIDHVDDVRILALPSVTDLIEVHLTIHGKTTQDQAVVPVSAGTRHSSMSYELLQYVKQKGWTLTPQGNYAIDLKDWDMDMPLFVLPLKHTNMLDYMKVIEAFLKASRSTTLAKDSLLDHETPESALRAFNVIVASQLKVNIAHLEILVKVAMISSHKHKDYRIPLEGNVVQYGTFSETMSMRSLSAGMAYEKHKHVLNNPSTYLATVRPPHILDPLLLPRAKRQPNLTIVNNGRTVKL